MVTKESFVQDVLAVFEGCPGNRVEVPGAGEIALFEQPTIGFAYASDPLFVRYKQKEVIGPEFMSPVQWLPEAQTVVSLFFPFSEAVRTSNRENMDWPSTQWLYARIEGQAFLNAFMGRLREHLENAGHKACVPFLDERFQTTNTPDGEDFHVVSTWSERHAAYAAGLGTFGLSRGLITEKGMAGRFGSVIVDIPLEPDDRPYTEVYEYCIRCGACAANCPAGAITLEHGKNNVKCNAYLSQTSKRYAPRYGCGKCQVGVPCERCAPGR